MTGMYRLRGGGRGEDDGATVTRRFSFAILSHQTRRIHRFGPSQLPPDLGGILFFVLPADEAAERFRLDFPLQPETLKQRFHRGRHLR